MPIGEARWRQRVTVQGRVEAVQVQERGGSPTVEARLVDRTGSIGVVFLGRRRVPGVVLGRWMRVSGMTVDSHGRLVVVNPRYDLLPAAPV